MLWLIAHGSGVGLNGLVTLSWEVQVKNTFLHFVHGSMEINEDRQKLRPAEIPWDSAGSLVGAQT